MNFLNILKDIEQVDGDFCERLTPRRKAMRQFAEIGKRMGLTTLPLMIGSMFKQAYSQTPTVEVEGVLQFALQIEYLQSEFYTRALAVPGLIPAGADQAAIATISQHESQHIAFLTSLLQAIEVTPIGKPNFDFSGGKGSGVGPFADTFSNYSAFLALAQRFEDTGVRAYKGQLSKLIGDVPALTAALNIHSVEARHAAHIRQMRKALGADLKPWITGNVSGISAEILPTYQSEEADIQGGIKITAIEGVTISSNAATEAFDEPLTQEQVLAIFDPFIVA